MLGGFLPTKTESRGHPLLIKGFIRSFLMFLVLFLVIPASSAQAATQAKIAWNRTYGGLESTDFATTVIQTRDGAFVLTGTTETSETGDAWLLKIRADGFKAWERTIGGPKGEAGNAGIQTADGGFALACTTNSYGAGKADFWLVKTDANGEIQWSQTYGGAEHDWPMDLIQLEDKGFLLVGWTQSYGAGGEDGWVVRTDAQGTPLWAQTYGSAGKEKLYTVLETADGGIVLGGEIDLVGTPDGSNAWFSKIDNDGNLQWTRMYGGASAETLSDIIEMPDGSFVLVASSASFGNGH
jgi:hypothetical protein